MGFLIAYLLFAVVIDLMLEAMGLKAPRQTSVAIHRRLWSDTLFDCRSKVFSVGVTAPRLPNQDKANRYRLRKASCLIASAGN